MIKHFFIENFRDYLLYPFNSYEFTAKLGSIQILRFLAAFLVLFGHLMMEAKKFKVVDEDFYSVINVFPWGAGVDLFFIISGFIIVYVMRNTQPSAKNIKSFLVRRIIRILPIYWFYSFLMIIAMLLFAHIISGDKLSIDHVIASLFFIPWPHPASGSIRPILGQGWTLDYEVFFYYIAAISIFLNIAIRKYFITAVICAVFFISSAIKDSSYIFEFFGSSIILEFLLGIWLYEFFIRVQKLSWWQSGGMVVVGVIMLIAGEIYMPQNDYRFIARGLPSLLIAAGIICSADLKREYGRVLKGLSLMGDASYSLYLSHPFVLIPFAAIWFKLGFSSAFLFVLVSLVACLIVALISFFYIEQPMIRFLSKRMEKYIK